METLKIVLTLLAIQAVIYYLYNVYQKWTMGYHDMKEVINPFRGWNEAKYAREFRRGYYACEEKYEDLKERVIKLEQNLSSEADQILNIHLRKN
ncbi:hypothetical protein [Mucilaginibacter ginkgonis]|uniref:Uncharacterized protein n=1 Tax=Mucilaginibacter ginkgonis TaxID=2682091 RepID=A0A6I4HUT6_9SPHI|nr:hypothetical protein [Mucilaginibacter ginkgonis]QQL50132.1 hypothetical protein GO620_001390 [Mucilaginibacter ginkgonis]